MRGPVGRAGGGSGGARAGCAARGQGAAAASASDASAAVHISAPLTATPALAEGLSLVDAGWAFHAVAATKVLSDSAGDYRVVGVLGAQVTGKSELISALLYDAMPPGIAIGAIAAAAATAGASRPLPAPAPPHVCLEARNSSLQAESAAPPAQGLSHGPSRLELRVHPGDRTLLLDSPPLWSASWVSELASNPEPPLLRGGACTTGSGTSIMSRAIADARSCGLASLPAEGVAELLGLQLGALMLAACHVVVLVVDAVDEPRLWEYLQVIDAVAHCIPDVGSAAAAAIAGAATGAAGGVPGGGGGGGFPAAGPSLDAHQRPGPRRVAELVVVLTGLHDDQLTVQHLRPQAELLRLALRSTRLLGSGAAAGRSVDVLRYLDDDEGDRDGGIALCDILGPLTMTGVATAGGASATAAGVGGSATGGGESHRTAAAGRDSEEEGDGHGDGGRHTAHSREPEGPSGAGQLIRQRRHQRQRKPETGGCGVLNFWALPRGWQRQEGQQRDPARARHSAAAHTARPPPPPALLAPLRAALLGLPRRPLALANPSAPGVAAATAAVGGNNTGPLPYTTAVHPQAHYNLSEREWLRGVERLWDVELQRCAPLERYYLARQRTAFAGGGGWPVGPR